MNNEEKITARIKFLFQMATHDYLDKFFKKEMFHPIFLDRKDVEYCLDNFKLKEEDN